MATRTTLSLLVAVAAAGLLAAVGCNLVLGTGYVVGAEDAASAQDVTTQDTIAPAPEGGDDAGDADATQEAAVDACPSNPQTKPQLESACTGARCEPFDNASRNTLCADAGTQCPQVPPFDAGITDTGAAEVSVLADSGLPSCFALPHGPQGGTLPQPVIFATGSTAIQPYMARVAQVLESLSLETVVYLGAGSCFGVNAMLDPNQNELLTIGTTATYYDPALDTNGNVQQGTCVIDDPSRIADLGISDVFPTTCVPALASQGGLPNNLHDFFGPVQVMEMVVPASSGQKSISAEAAYMVWGYGGGSGVTPWTDEAFLLQRNGSSGTQNMIAAAIDLNANEWHGVMNKGSGNVLGAITNVANGKGIDGGPTTDPKAIDKTMGILASDVADNQRQYLKPLAFQDVGEACGWYPDSTVSSFDKRNVRDGHYPIWGPSHLVAYVDVNGNATNAAVKTLIDAMNGRNATVLATLDVVQFYAKSHIVPTCAMHVQRAQDGHDYQPFSPATSCSCYYDLEATGQTDCTQCQHDSDCVGAPGGATTCVTAFGIPPAGYCEPPGSGQ